MSVPSPRLRVRVDRDAVARDDGRRPWQRELTIDGEATLTELVELLGLPLAFTDDRGVWALMRGQEAEDGVHILAVVEQIPAPEGPPRWTVHMVSHVPPAQLADDGVVDLHFRSLPGPPREVVAAAHRGDSYSRPAAEGQPADNAPVRTALETYAADQTAENALDVLRQAFGGQLVLDATGSTFGDEARGGVTRLVINFIRAPDGSKALPAFTGHAELVKFREEDEEGPRSLVQPADRVLAFFVRDPEARWLYIDPAGPPLGIRRDQVEFALQAGHNAPVKNALTRPDLTMQDLFDALRVPGGILFVGDRGQGEDIQPLVVDTGGSEKLLAFTSAVEAAAWDRTMRFHRLSVGGVLELVLELGAQGLLLNPGGPSATVSALQVRRFLGTWQEATA
ncbi:SseB family protein [Georgenia thermotolerans]|uniref:SseB protein N-terminal domain-containing protein n=1 Tax=Georgenia thermotolerans TaxID=527326 RepID=A0A7J5UKG5_9MICO|nr:SseB family protein [Georgenia thermotolerans]KAE8762847.1 hypothetical protein GB883_17265 [Georgenia thermotolerans]